MAKEVNCKEMEDMEDEFQVELKTEEEIWTAEYELTDKLWYSRRWEDLEQMKAGEMEPYESETIAIIVKSAKKLEKKYGKANLAPYSDFDLGMLYGKISAIRWVLGMGWDEFMT
jgi:hypothetical protein